MLIKSLEKMTGYKINDIAIVNLDSTDDFEMLLHLSLELEGDDFAGIIVTKRYPDENDRVLH